MDVVAFLLDSWEWKDSWRVKLCDVFASGAPEHRRAYKRLVLEVRHPKFITQQAGKWGGMVRSVRIPAVRKVRVVPGPQIA